MGADGAGHGQVDGLPLEGRYPMHLWQPGISYPDSRTLDLPDDLAPGRYRLEAGFYDLDTGDRLAVTEGPGRLPGDTLILDYVTVPGPEEADAPAVSLDAEFGANMRLLGVSPDLAEQPVRPASKLDLTLHWQALAPTDEAYTLFVHVTGADGMPLSQYDGQPQGGFYPTAFWDPGERLVERVTLEIPAGTAPGTYQVLAGFYLLATGDRLSVTGADASGGDAALLATIEVSR